MNAVLDSEPSESLRPMDNVTTLHSTVWHGPARTRHPRDGQWIASFAHGSADPDTMPRRADGFDDYVCAVSENRDRLQDLEQLGAHVTVADSASAAITQRLQGPREQPPNPVAGRPTRVSRAVFERGRTPGYSCASMALARCARDRKRRMRCAACDQLHLEPLARRLIAPSMEPQR